MLGWHPEGVIVAAAPSSPPAIVQQLRRDERRLGPAIAGWQGRGPVPGAVKTLAVDRQRAVRAAGTGTAATAVMQLAPAERDDLLARRALARLGAATPPLRQTIRVAAPAPATQLLSWYREAGQRFGVQWQLLAAVNFVESAFGKVRNTSVAGAQGPMQFLPATWKAYGLGGNVHDPHDAILGAANYLAASGARTNARAALHRYNPSSLYVNAVLHYTHRIAHVPYAFYEYYAWQVYVRLPNGTIVAKG
jgi:membrane-bound lytic murein transglycosylase B